MLEMSLCMDFIRPFLYVTLFIFSYWAVRSQFHKYPFAVACHRTSLVLVNHAPIALLDTIQ